MEESVFDVFESLQEKPCYLYWFSCLKPVPVHDFLYASELLTIDKSTGTFNKGFYVLTRSSLIRSVDLAFKNPVDALAILRLRNPRVFKIERPSLNLYPSLYP
eukprot:TRINITY_DN1902_c0_g1_i5.p1 TRINITY_DN1902_c0_g1~~TRINITY_DN1902_c0_g1_i5.p1  ORF type:complete len:103 (+),score=14.59 TRINITY_DN1902_c0_g1_i5:125-433(+)